MKVFVKNIGQLLSFEPFVNSENQDLSRPWSEQSLGILENAWLLIDGGIVVSSGPMSSLPSHSTLTSTPCEILDAKGQLVTPGLVDSHVHGVFAGSRSLEFGLKLAGASYQEIAAAGGGIHSTVRATRSASDETLLENIRSLLHNCLVQGVTTTEIKTGYGQCVEEEIRGLKLLNAAQETSQVTVFRTLLALHAYHPTTGSMPKDAWLRRQAEGLLTPDVKKLCDAVDGFIENGYFSTEEAEPFFSLAKKKGLQVRIHADEFQDSGAATAAATWGALSADHLECASEAGLLAMRDKGVVATALPLTSLYSKIPFANARKWRDLGLKVAVASDYNPGSAPIHNLPLAMSLVARHGGLTGPESLIAATVAAAHSLQLWPQKGNLSAGADGDFVIWPFRHFLELIADFGQTRPLTVRTRRVPGLS